MGKVVIIAGSRGDIDHCNKIKGSVERFGVGVTIRIASAHKVPLRVLDILKSYEAEDVVFVTVAGRSNALSGFVDANTQKPVIACPPYSEKFGGADLFSSLRMPSGVAPMVVLEPEEAGLAAVKILALKDEGLRKKIGEYQDKLKREIEEADKEVSKNG